jgi:teichuronic acid biosynthesis glycosyltransferase TuaC
MSSYRVLVATNLWPTEADPGYGSFVQAQMESLRPLGVQYDVLFVNGRESKWNYVRGILEMRRRLRNHRFDLIHAHFGLAGWVARFQLGVPVVVSFMGDDVLGRYKRNGRISFVGRIFRISSLVLARLVSEVIVKTRPMKSQLGLGAAHVIPNGVDLNLFRPTDAIQARRSLGLDLRKKFALFPYDPALENKRHDLIRAAIDIARERAPELELLVVFAKPRPKFAQFLNASNVLVLASNSEGSPNVVKEAMACNLPVVTVAVGDAAELIGSTEGCFVVPRDARAIAEKIVEVCQRAMRTRGREKIAALSEENIGKRILQVYDAALARERK